MPSDQTELILDGVLEGDKLEDVISQQESLTLTMDSLGRLELLDPFLLQISE